MQLLQMMSLRGQITILLSVSVLATPLMSAAASECEFDCCVASNLSCTMPDLQECPTLEASLPIQNLPIALEKTGRTTMPVSKAVDAPTNAVYAHGSFSPVNRNAHPRLSIPLTVPLII